MATVDEIAATLGASRDVFPVTVPELSFSTELPVYRCAVRKVVDRGRVKTYNKGESAKLDDGNGYPTFAELIVIARLRGAGWQAGWANNARDPSRLIMGWAADAVDPIRTSPPAGVLSLLGQIREGAENLVATIAAAGSGVSGGGVLDVIAWRGDQVRFIECKHLGQAWRDALQRSQRVWIAAALGVGVPPDHLGVFEWTFQGTTPE